MQHLQLGYVMEAMIFYEKKGSRIIDGCSLRAHRSVLQYELHPLILSALPGITFLLRHVGLCFILDSMIALSFQSFYSATLP
jgi:hypothetical protein